MAWFSSDRTVVCRQVRRLQEGREPGVGVGSDESSGSFTDPLSSSRGGHRSATSNTVRQEAEPDTATLTDALVADELPLDETPVRRPDEPLHPDSIELCVDESDVSVTDSVGAAPDLARSCEPALLHGLLSESAPAPAAADKTRSFSQSDVFEPRPPTRPAFTVTKHRKVDLGGRLNQTATGLEHTTSEHWLPGQSTDTVYPTVTVLQLLNCSQFLAVTAALKRAAGNVSYFML